MAGCVFKVIQPWLSQLITSTLPGCICNYCEQVHYSASSPQSWRFNLEMLPGILTPLITTASSMFSHRDETLWTSGRGKAHNYFLFYSEGSTGGEDVVFAQRNWALVGKLCEHRGKPLLFCTDGFPGTGLLFLKLKRKIKVSQSQICKVFITSPQNAGIELNGLTQQENMMLIFSLVMSSSMSTIVVIRNMIL